ncbi:hypothetical protein BCUN_1338 [Bifidobacterium cuniculi]|uniref:DUF2974 domain-containing protein n=1 Tax=Bifidobacterium cuniculi TaxID=1688 RepID=A0A087AX70_9BIFI|nr:hypothetical protein BCUN_1338 [Bifidobacterium cuniculi]
MKDYGDATFEQVKPNTLDLLVLAELSNFDYASHTAGTPIAHAIERAVLPTITSTSHRTIVSLNNKEDLELAQVVKQAGRYRNVTMADFRAHYVEGGQQFGALAVRVGDTLCVAFRATDLTVTGWHESLELSRDEPTGSQRDAATFLKDVHARFGGPLIVCGHSKGGNLAEFACRQLVEDDPESVRDIQCICNFDGPGLAPRYRRTDAYRLIEPLIHAFIPKSSIVGNIHDHGAGRVSYIDSRKPFVMQHYVYNWKTRGIHLMGAHQTLLGKVVCKALNTLIDVTDDAFKQRLFTVMFKPYRVLGRRLL